MLADIIVIAILVVIVALVIRTIIKSKKAGKSLLFLGFQPSFYFQQLFTLKMLASKSNNIQT